MGHHRSQAKPLIDPSHHAAPSAAGHVPTATWEENPFPRSKLPRTGEYLVGRSKELAKLTRAWSNPKTSIVQIVAPGGVGKTQLVKKWQERLLDSEDHGGAVRTFDWSFYSQGTQQQASADEFSDRALRWFGEADPENYKDSRAKGERLAELVKEQRTLLILDGMEPLQHPPGPEAGELTDHSIKALLRALQRDNPGLCIVTSREAVPTLNEMSEPKRQTIDLGTLLPEAGAALLEHYGVRGEPDDMQQASVDVEGHALALILLGTYLKARCGGDVARRKEALLFKGHERYAAHAQKVMASYEAWFKKEDDIGRAAVAILRLMGLFNRPADAGCLAALRAEPSIRGLTEDLFVGDRNELWNRAVERLRAARLLTDVGRDEGTLDAHPLIREHFARQLDEQFPVEERETHRRLFEYLKQSAPVLPDNLSDMMSLYHAVAHGCSAERHDDALNVYTQRICRNNDDGRPENFAVEKLGCVMTELVALGKFFEQPWKELSAGLSEDNKEAVRYAAGRQLWHLGMLDESKGLAIETIHQQHKQGNFRLAANALRGLIEIFAYLGDLANALFYGVNGAAIADNSHDSMQRVSTRCALGFALTLCGKLKVAKDVFDDARQILALERTDGEHHLRDMAGFWYCEWLVTCGNAESLDAQAVHSRPGFYTETNLLREAQYKMYCADSQMLKLNFEEARKLYDESERLYRQAAQTPHLPQIYVRRARVLRKIEEFEKASDDLAEAKGIMKQATPKILIWEIEAALERTRLSLALFPREKTGTPRRFPMWSETIEAVKASFSATRSPNPGNEQFLFITRKGNCWSKVSSGGTLSREWQHADLPRLAGKSESRQKHRAIPLCIRRQCQSLIHPDCKPMASMPCQLQDL